MKTQTTAAGDRDRGRVLRNDPNDLNGTNMSACLAETGFISNPTFEAKFHTAEYQQLIANAIAAGIAQFANLAPVPPEPIPPRAGANFSSVSIQTNRLEG